MIFECNKCGWRGDTAPLAKPKTKFMLGNDKEPICPDCGHWLTDIYDELTDDEVLYEKARSDQ